MDESEFKPSKVYRWKMGFDYKIRKSVSSFYFEPYNLKHLQENNSNILRKVSVCWIARNNYRRDCGYVVRIEDFLVNFEDFQPCENSALFSVTSIDFSNSKFPVVTIKTLNLVQSKVYHRIHGESAVEVWISKMRKLPPVRPNLENAVLCFEIFRLRAWGYSVDESKNCFVSKGLLLESSVIIKRCKLTVYKLITYMVSLVL